MHDVRFLRRDPEAFDAALARRGLEPQAQAILQDDTARREALTELQAQQARRKSLARDIGVAKRTGADSTTFEAEALALREAATALEVRAAEAERVVFEKLAALPNLLDDEVPEGRDESANVIVKQVGEIRSFPFTPKQHFELGESLGQMDFSTAAKLSGARFTVLRGGLARLERALGQFMLDMHVREGGYTETSVPLLVNDAAMFGTDKLPKFATESFRTEDGRWLIPTAEVPLTASVAEMVLDPAELPMRLTALSQCFRSEAGSAGRDVRGMLRQHQFSKVELVSISLPEQSIAEHERMTRCAETILEQLELPYRRMLLCAGDTGFGAAKTYDLEAWLPGQGAWREISSCSNTRSFQARRMNARYRGENGLDYVHTLNGSGLAIGRTMIAVLENYQNADATITIPAALHPYMHGLTVIS